MNNTAAQVKALRTPFSVSLQGPHVPDFVLSVPIHGFILLHNCVDPKATYKIALHRYNLPIIVPGRVYPPGRLFLLKLCGESHPHWDLRLHSVHVSQFLYEHPLWSPLPHVRVSLAHAWKQECEAEAGFSFPRQDSVA